MSGAHQHSVGLFPSCLASLLLLALALASGTPGTNGADDPGGLPDSSVACVEPGNCPPVDAAKDGSAAHLTLRELLNSLVSARTMEKRGKQDSGVNGFSSDEKEAIVRIHNQLRQSVDPPASNMLEMSWSDELGKVANNCASQCKFGHNSDRGQQAKSFTSVGENIYAHSGSYDEVGAVQSWFNEDQYYNYTSHACSKVCGHYTQVVWAKSHKVGCGVKYCKPLRGVSWASGYIIVCNYGPAGNYRGVRPYEEGSGKTKLLTPPGSDSGAGDTSSNNNSPSTTDKKTKKPRKKKTKKPRKKKTKKPRKKKTKKPRKKKTKKPRKKKTKKPRKKKTKKPKKKKTKKTKTTETPTLKRTCQRGRQRALELKIELQEELKNAQPASTDWRNQVRRTCSRGRTSMEDMKKRLQEAMDRWRQQQQGR